VEKSLKLIEKYSCGLLRAEKKVESTPLPYGHIFDFRKGGGLRRQGDFILLEYVEGIPNMLM